MSTPDRVRRTRRSNLRDEVAIAAVFVAIWTLLWGELSVANLVSGVLVALLLLVVFPVGHEVTAVRHRVRPLAAVRLVVFFLSDLVLSTLVTAVDVVRPRSRIQTGIVACPLRVQNDGLLTFLANVIAAAPGTMPIDVSVNPHVIYVHVLHNEDPERTRRLVSRLEELAVAVLGGPEALAAVREPRPEVSAHVVDPPTPPATADHAPGEPDR